jgi:hypothetical protein
MQKSKIWFVVFTCSKDLLALANYAAYQSRRSYGCHVMVYPIIHA